MNRAYLDWLSSDDCEDPLMAYVHYMDVHNPYDPPPEYAEIFVSASGEYKYSNSMPLGDAVPTPTDLVYMQQLYDAEIRYVDALIQQIHERTVGHCDRETITQCFLL